MPFNSSVGKKGRIKKKKEREKRKYVRSERLSTSTDIFTRAYRRIFVLHRDWRFLAAACARNVMFLSRWHAYKDPGGPLHRVYRRTRSTASGVHVAVSLSAGPVLHHRSADRKGDARTGAAGRRREWERDRNREREIYACARSLDTSERGEPARPKRSYIN